jgi:predicted ATPase
LIGQWLSMTLVHIALAAHFGQDVRVSALSYRSNGLWMLGWPDAALADAARAIEDARGIGQATTSMYAAYLASFPLILRGDYASAKPLVDELVALADEKSSLFWKAIGMLRQGSILALTSRASEAVHVITCGLSAHRPTGSTLYTPWHLSNLARAHAELGQFDNAGVCVCEALTAIEATKEKWCEADVHRIAGEIALMSPERDAAKAEAYFERALATARAQQAKSWELRAAMSMARLWRDQGKHTEARNLLAPVYGWFTEGFDTLDLKQAKELLEELVS